MTRFSQEVLSLQPLQSISEGRLFTCLMAPFLLVIGILDPLDGGRVSGPQLEDGGPGGRSQNSGAAPRTVLYLAQGDPGGGGQSQGLRSPNVSSRVLIPGRWRLLAPSSSRSSRTKLWLRNTPSVKTGTRVRPNRRKRQKSLPARKDPKRAETKMSPRLQKPRLSLARVRRVKRGGELGLGLRTSRKNRSL